MALPVYANFLANLRGPQGDEGEKGRPGTFDEADAVSVPSTAPAEAIISGEFGEKVTFKIPKGDPGTNAVPTDEAIGTYVGTPGSNSRTAVAGAVNTDGATAMANTGSALSQASQGLFPVYRAWDGTTYPARVAGAFNIFVGPADPGLLMAEGDRWEPGDATSLPAVVAAAQDTSSDLYEAIGVAAGQSRIPLNLRSATLTYEAIGTSPNRMFGWRLPTGSISALYGSCPVPQFWNSARARFRWTRIDSGTGNARLSCEIAPYSAAGGAAGGSNAQTSSAVPALGQLKDNPFANATVLNPGDGIGVAFNRIGNSGSDTFPYDIWLIDAWLERLS